MEYSFTQATVDIPAHISVFLTSVYVSATQPVSAARLFGATSLRQNQDAQVSTIQTNHAQTNHKTNFRVWKHCLVQLHG